MIYSNNEIDKFQQYTKQNKRKYKKTVKEHWISIKKKEKVLKKVKKEIYKDFLDLDEENYKEFSGDIGKFLKTNELVNKYSLALLINNEILFMGDLKSSQINKVISEELNGSKIMNKSKLELLIAPHHGTHWNESFIDFIDF